MTQKNIFEQNVKFVESVRKDLRKKRLPQRNPYIYIYIDKQLLAPRGGEKGDSY
jgi:hypothetical protein